MSGIIEQAAQWAAMLDAGELSDRDREACTAWCAKDPLHRHTLDRMRALGQRLDEAEDFERDALRTMLKRDRFGRRGIGGTLLGLCLLLAVGWAGLGSDFIRDNFPDYQTGRGELRTVALDDGSEIVVDTDGAIRVDFDAGLREVRLVRGQLLARVARDRGRPFVVETPHGSVTALGTAFIVRREQSHSLVTVIESQVRLCPARPANEDGCRVLGAGQRARITSAGVLAEAAVDPSAAAMWSSGWLEADDEEVTAVLAELARYSARPVRFDAASLKGIKVTGSFPLRDVDRAIDGIARTANLRVGNSAEDIVVERRF